ncbi:MAG: hypothetical protein CVU64_11475 [Deltaproteobacteria bacterium HGW-Deltaproteobacteria-21]|nr:MAG: hypothetical protein CVU64_11475 [Deltaproteobacteria bacterium HGW-Deltaproteobacteria-21]
MSYQFITNLVIVLHLLWILFLIFGFYFVLKGSRIAFIHASGLLFSLVLNLMGWYCPLTHLENRLESAVRHGERDGKSFVARILEKAIYPDVDEALIRKGEIIFVVMNGIAYAWAFRRRRFSGFSGFFGFSGSTPDKPDGIKEQDRGKESEV